MKNESAPFLKAMDMTAAHATRRRMTGAWLKPELYERLQAHAKRERRSLSNATELLLEKTLDGEEHR